MRFFPTSDSETFSCKFTLQHYWFSFSSFPHFVQDEKLEINFHFFLFAFIPFYSTRGSLFIQWFVSSISKDIADFYLHFRDGKNKILLEKTLAYDTRIGNITSSQLEGIDFDRNVDVCILAKNSNGVILNFDESQCTRMPSNFNAIMTKYNKRPSTFFKLFEMDRKNLGRNTIALKSRAPEILTSLPLIILFSIPLLIL